MVRNVFLFGILLISLLSFVSADSRYCCEKTTNGAWCQNAPQEECDDEFRMSSASCEATTYCKLGCCYNSDEGECMTNTPEIVCQESNGVWEDSAACEIPQCEAGCCVLGDQASFVTKTRCKRLSSIFGLETNFKGEIKTEMECIQSITSDVEGACVFEQEFEQTCLRTTKKECLEKGDDVKFYENFLCSASELNTICGSSEKTTCVEGKDQVFFIDTCGNIANVYDASKQNDPEYWRKIKDVSESCGYEGDNADSSSCGNCDYFLGSTCAEFEADVDESSPDFGDNICRDLNCEWSAGSGEEKKHGESWCMSTAKSPELIDSPGARDYRLLCYNGEVIEEPCAERRAEVCVEDSIETTEGEFSAAACRANRWQDCITIDNEKECENENARDCQWIDNNDKDFNLIIKRKGGKVCVPEYAPGFNFWEPDDDSKTICSQGSAKCVVTYSRELDNSGLGGAFNAAKEILGNEGAKTDWEVKKNEYCLSEDYKQQAQNFCSLFGDCGSSVNYLDYKGYFEIDDLFSSSGKLDAEELEDFLEDE